MIYCSKCGEENPKLWHDDFCNEAVNKLFDVKHKFSVTTSNDKSFYIRSLTQPAVTDFSKRIIDKDS